MIGTMYMKIIIRDMVPEDYDQKAYIHYKTWIDTYSGLIGPQFLAHQTLEKCRSIARRWPQNTLVADCSGETVGFGCYIRHPDGSGEINAIYILKEFHGMGIGKKLMNALMEQLGGCTPVSLWVLQGNDQAIGFYQHCGFCFDGTYKPIFGSSATELRMICSRF